jgi:spore maturation protein SpmA
MLNYIWLALLVLGIGAALTKDVIDEADNRFRNGEPFSVEITLNEPFKKDVSKTYDGEMIVHAAEFNKFYSQNIKNDFSEKVRLTFDLAKKRRTLFFKVSSTTPKFWKEMAKVSGKEDDLTGIVKDFSMKDSLHARAQIVLEKITFAKMKDVTNAALDYAQTAVTIALGLIGIMALWLGVMKIAEEAGLIKIIARVVRPITKFLFPDVPQEHPAMGSMIMNISANMLGLGNAATPFGLKAMEELESINPNKGVASNAMIMFLAINTSGFTLIPATAIAIRAAAGSSDPTIIIGTSMFGAACATLTGITLAKLFEQFPLNFSRFGNWFKRNLKKIGILLGTVAVGVILSYAGALGFVGKMFSAFNPETFKFAVQVISTLAIPLIIFSFVTYGLIKKVKVYESFVEGAKEGFDIAVKIIPYLVGMLVAIGIFRAGGMMDVLQDLLAYPAHLIGMPKEALPMALIRPLSGSGSAGVMAEIMTHYGPDSLIGIMVSTFFGSTETTFYVLAVYFGAVNIRKTRHAVLVGLAADFAGIVAATFIVNQLFG